jgi:L-threonylcarbamoyladenylate synthase
MINISEYTPDLIIKSALTLKSGNLVAFPTETVYGLGADATNELAVSKIYSVKGRPSNHPLIVHISSANKMFNWAEKIPNYAHELANKYWPGSMTLILQRKNIAKNFVTGSQNSIGIRVPDHPVAIELLRKFESIGGLGIAAPSANRFGAVSPTTAESVQIELGEYLHNSDLIIDGGQCQVGLESTIIDCTGNQPIILRPGAVTSEMIHRTIKVDFLPVTESSILRSSGLFKSHYSPKAKVELNIFAKPGEGFIALENVPTPQGAVRLMAPRNVEQFAKEIYLALRTGDTQKLDKIVIILPNGDGIAEAIRDRMLRAAN